MQFYLTQVSNMICTKVCGIVISLNLFSLTAICISPKQKLVLFKQLLLNKINSTHFCKAIRQFHEFVTTELWVPVMARRQRCRNFTGQEVTLSQMWKETEVIWSQVWCVCVWMTVEAKNMFVPVPQFQLRHFGELPHASP